MVTSHLFCITKSDYVLQNVHSDAEMKLRKRTIKTMGCHDVVCESEHHSFHVLGNKILSNGFKLIQYPYSF